jgi:predicted amidohydrolase YtcJ
VTELWFRGGTVWTGLAERPVADSLVVRDGRITGFDRPAGRAAEVDLAGGFLLPAFGDGHAHPILAGLEPQGPLIGGLASVREIVAAVREYAVAHPHDEWIVGGGYDPTLAPGGEFDARWLDAAVPDRPVVLRCSDYHAVWCNTAALRRVGPLVGPGVPLRPDGGVLGTLREWDACGAVLDLVPPPAAESLAAAARGALAVYAAAGVTWVQDAWVEPGSGFADAYLACGSPVRVAIALRADQRRWPDQLAGLRAERDRLAGSRVAASTVKFFADGVVETSTAAVLEPYVDGGHGCPVWQREALADAVAAVDRAGFDVHVHAIGDGGVRTALDAIEHAIRVNPPWDRRPVVAHVQLAHPDDVPRFARLGVIANFEPLWAQHDPAQPLLTEPRLGADRAARQYPIRSVLAAGATISFGSDWPVSPPRPLAGIQTAVTRRAGAGEPQLGGAQAITVSQALAAYTSGVAYQARAERTRGVLAPGRVADLVHLAADPRAVPPDEIGAIEVRGTWLAGRAVRPPY